MIKVRLDNKATHEALWNWLAKHPDRNKHAWPGHETIGKLIDRGILKMSHPDHLLRHYCVACQEALEIVEKNGLNPFSYCTVCPVVFYDNDTRGKCEQFISYYYIWKTRHCSTGKYIYPRHKRVAAAKKIAKGWEK